jgi:murein DD-endopeptidase MepM/ murein hydrolase activator NlpD
VVIIDHGSSISTLYGHCSSLSVSDGQSVKSGQVVAYVGSTGYSTGPHLHFEVRKNGKPIDPMSFH